MPVVSDEYLSLPFFLSWGGKSACSNGCTCIRRKRVSTDVVWEQAVVTGLVFLARSDCDLFKGMV